jgi:hypothetical protein
VRIRTKRSPGESARRDTRREPSLTPSSTATAGPGKQSETADNLLLRYDIVMFVATREAVAVTGVTSIASGFPPSIGGNPAGIGGQARVPPRSAMGLQARRDSVFVFFPIRLYERGRRDIVILRNNSTSE